MSRRSRSPAPAWGLSISLIFGLAGCAASGPRAQTNPAAPATSSPAVDAQALATEHFYRGKAFALAGDNDCARLEFDDALESFRKFARPDDPSDRLFAGQLWESLLLYRSATEGRAESEERPPLENPKDSLLATAPPPKPEEVENARREVLASGAPAVFDIPVTVNEAVLRAVAYYQFRTPQAFAAALQRSGRYLELMRGILKEQGLPQDLVYVAMVESAFKNNAHSRKAAHGFWQFIDGTGRRYGLHRTRAVDERSDPVKSTLAAAGYFKDLYEMFGDWYLAMAAYDAGEGKILKGLQRTGARDYWELAAGNFLRRETRDYVPFVLAAALIAKDPVRYGFDVVPDPPLRFEVVTVTKPVDLARVAEAAGAPFEDLRLLNGELKTRSTPHGVAEYPLRVPAGTTAAILGKLSSLPAAPEIEERHVTVKRGDTLAKVAAKNHVSVAELCEWNDLPKNAALKRGTILALPGRRGPKAAAAPPEPLAAAPVPPAPSRGEIRALPTPASAVTNPVDVATRGVTPATPFRRPLPSRVDIPAEGFETVPSRPAATRKVFHTVRQGDTLFSIAQRYGTTVDAIRSQNRIGRRALLRAGQRLTLIVALAR